MSMWNCPSCGTTGNAVGAQCRGCGHQLVPDLALVRDDGEVIVSSISLSANQTWARRMLGDEGRFWDTDWQMRFERQPDGWLLIANPAAPNETLLNGATVVTNTRLKGGDVVSVGRAAKGVSKTPVTVRSA